MNLSKTLLLPALLLSGCLAGAGETDGSEKVKLDFEKPLNAGFLPENGKSVYCNPHKDVQWDSSGKAPVRIPSSIPSAIWIKIGLSWPGLIFTP